MNKEQIIELLNNNKAYVIRQKHWLSYEGLKWSDTHEGYLDEIGFFYPTLDAFSNDNWEVVPDADLFSK